MGNKPSSLLKVIFLLSANSSGQELRYPFQRITAENGLSQATVGTICQDHVGFLWLGTQDGLNRYDGYTFTTFRADRENPNAISGSWIRVVYQDRQGGIWAGTRHNGLNRFDQSTGHFQAYLHREDEPTSLSENEVRAILEDSQGTFWVGTRGGLNSMNRKKGTFTAYKHDPKNPSSLSHDAVRVLFQDSQGTFWIGTEGGLNRFNRANHDFQAYLHDPGDDASLSHSMVLSIYEDRENNLWIGTLNGLNRLDRNTEHFQRYQVGEAKPGSQTFPIITSIAQDTLGKLWVGTLRGGLFLMEADESFSHIKHRNDDPKSLSNEDVRSILVDRTGVVWVGTDGGLNRFDQSNRRFSIIREAEEFGLTNPWTWSILEDENGVLWVGTDGHGIDRLDRVNQQSDNFRHIPDDPQSLSHNRIRSLIQDRAGYYWAGTDGEGLERFTCQSDAEGKLSLKVTHFKQGSSSGGLAGNRVIGLLEDRQERLWVCSLNGLTRFDRDRKRSHIYRNDPQQANSLPHNETLSILQDRADSIWVGTRGGLSRLLPEKDHFVHFKFDPNNPRSLSQNVVRCMAVDQEGHLWVGTYGGGLNKMDPETGYFTRYQEKDGLANNVVYGILVAADGTIWMSTNRGLSHLDPKLEKFQNYTTSDGLQGHEFNSGAYFQSPRGEMFFGGIEGINAFFPERITADPIPPNVVLTKIQINNKDMEGIGQQAHRISEITLKPYHHSVSFEFAALHYAGSSKNQYAYKLVGFSDQWHYTSADRRFANFTNLKPGPYELQIKASNKDGVWSTDNGQLSIRVEPPLWKTTWAKFFYVLFPILLLHLYQRRQKAMRDILEKQVVKRTKELAAKNTQLVLTQKELVSAAHGAGMAEIASAILHNAGNILNTINTSAFLITDGIGKYPVTSISKVTELLNANQDNLARFLSEDPTGCQLVQYLESISLRMIQENNSMSQHAEKLVEKLQELRKVIAQQDTYVSSSLHWEIIDLEQMVEAALKIMDSRLEDSGIRIERNYFSNPKVPALKTKLVQAFVNILKNACDSMSHLDPAERLLHLKLFVQKQSVRLEFCDNGQGIDPSDLKKIFAQGFSTRSDSHGFGLHFCANAMKEMGGAIFAENNGAFQGAKIVLLLPLSQEETRTQEH